MNAIFLSIYFKPFLLEMLNIYGEVKSVSDNLEIYVQDRILGKVEVKIYTVLITLARQVVLGLP